MAQWCESCGQRVPDGEEHAGAIWLGEPNDQGSRSFSPATGPKKKGREKKLAIGVIGLVAVWGLFIGVGRVVSPDGSVDEQAAAEIQEARIEREVAQAVEEAAAERAAAEADQTEVPEIAEVEGDYGAADAAPGFPDADSAEAGIDAVGTREGDALAVGTGGAFTEQAERLQRQIERRGSATFLAYESADGVVVIDLVGGETVIQDPDAGIATVRPGAPMLRSGATTFSIDSDSLAVNRVGEGSSIVVSDARDGNTYFVDAGTLSSQSSIVEVIAEGTYGFHRAPTGGLQLLPADGLGLLAVPQGVSGETLIAGADSFDVLSPNRVLSGTSQAVLEEVCVEAQACSLVITNLTSGEQAEVPQSFVRFGDRYSLAPDGRALLRYSAEGFGELFLADPDSISWVVGAGMSEPAWAPNSDFIAWLDDIGDPKLKMMFVDDRDWLSVDLYDLGAPPPVSPELLVFIPRSPTETG